MRKSKRDHPRTRGEKLVLMPETFGKRGSPPHTRGKVFLKLPDNTEIRITPAHAGKSEAVLEIANGLKDHPRTRGEKHSAEISLSHDSGSPPHTRGKGLVEAGCVSPLRITPAHAGKRNDPEDESSAQ